MIDATHGSRVPSLWRADRSREMAPLPVPQDQVLGAIRSDVIKLRGPSSRQGDKRPRIRETDRTVKQVGPPLAMCRARRIAPKARRRLHTLGGRLAEASRQLHEIRIVPVGSDGAVFAKPVAMRFHVAVGTVADTTETRRCHSAAAGRTLHCFGTGSRRRRRIDSTGVSAWRPSRRRGGHNPTQRALVPATETCSTL